MAAAAIAVSKAEAIKEEKLILEELYTTQLAIEKAKLQEHFEKQLAEVRRKACEEFRA
jgi:diphthamide biosynthesis methyltransferase